MEEFSISDRTLKILENSIETTGKLKGTIELLAKDLQAVEKSLDDHSRDGKESINEIKNILNKLLSSCNDMKISLSSIPFSKLEDLKKESDKNISNKFSEIIHKIDDILGWIDDNEVASEANVKGKWALITAVITTVLIQVGTIIVVLLRTR